MTSEGSNDYEVIETMPDEGYAAPMQIPVQGKLVKMRIRSQMSETTLDSLLRIVLKGPLIDAFPVADAVKLWAAKKNRRLTI